MLAEKTITKIIVGVLIGSILSTAGAIFTVLVAVPRIEQKLDDKVELLHTKLTAERDRSTVIDDYSTAWLKSTSDRTLSNTSRIKGLETSTGIHHNDNIHPHQ